MYNVKRKFICGRSCLHPYNDHSLIGPAPTHRVIKLILFSQPPVNDHQAATGILGLRPSTTTAHIVRAILESIAFRVVQLYRCTAKETTFRFTEMRVDGGVSQNDFICQSIADLTGLRVERAVNSDSSAIGVGFVAGLKANVWSSRDELLKLRKIDRLFTPNKDNHKSIVQRMDGWERALERFKYWYSSGELNEVVA